MNFKLIRTTILSAFVIVFNLNFCQSVTAQIEETIKLKNQEFNKYLKLNLPPFSTELQSNYFKKQSFQNFNHSKINIFKPQQNNQFTTILFAQNKTEDLFQGLGSYEFFNNKLTYMVNNKLMVDLGIGLASQNSVLNPSKPNYQIGLSASVEFEITPRLNAFIYGQYFTSSINRPKDFFDPLIYKNPMFLQSEVGAGLKRNYKNMNTKFQINSMYDKFENKFTPINSKISIGF